MTDNTDTENAEGETDVAEEGDIDDRLETVLANLERFAEYLDEQVAENGVADDALGGVEDFQTLFAEAEELVAAIEVSELPEAIDTDQLAEAVEVDSIPEALRERDPSDAVDTVALIRAIDFDELWGSADVRELWTDKGEFQAALDEVSGDEGPIPEMDDDDADEELVEMEADDVSELDEPFLDAPQESRQTAIQVKAMEGIDEFRESLIASRKELKGVIQENRERFNSRADEGTSSRNPTAVSTIPARCGSEGDRGKYSTVPRETRYSTAPNRRRIYGSRFEDEEAANDE